MTDLILDGHNSFLFAESDAHGMAEKMLLHAKYPELSVRMGKLGRKHVEEVGSTENNIARLQSVLKAAATR